MSDKPDIYYVPSQSRWPIIGAISMFFLVIGAANFVQQSTGKVDNNGSLGWLTLLIGFSILLYMIFGWFGNVIDESQSGLYSKQMDRSFRMGMFWFIFSEVMFFAAFFGALFYLRTLSVPWLGGVGDNFFTHSILWPNTNPDWPLLTTPDGSVTTQAMSPWGIPLINTIILITSALTLTYSHFSLKLNNIKKTIVGLILTLVLAVIFLTSQAYEYHHAYTELNLTLASGVYGNTFFLLTGFHGLHVLIGATMLLVVLIRCIKRHFSNQHHFAFEASVWYWHFVDYIWLLLFVTVYCL